MKVEWVRVGDVLEMRRDPIEIRDGESYRKIGIYSWGRGMIHHPPTPAVEMGSLRYFRFPAQALMLSNIQAWEQAVAVTSEQESAGFVSSNRFLPYVPIDQSVHVPYLVHYLLSEGGYELLKRASPGTQVRNRTLGKRLFEDERVPLPSCPDQVRIAAHLDSLSRTGQCAQRLSGAVQARVRAVRNQVLGMTGAEERLIGEVTSLAQHAVEVVSDQSYRTLGIKNRGRGVFPRPAVRGDETKYKTYFRVSAGQLIFSKLFAWEGSVAIVPREFDGFHVSPEFPTFEIDATRVSPEFLGHVIRSDHFADRLAGATTGMGQRRQRVNPAQFSELVIPLPSRPVQERVVGVLAAADRAAGCAAVRLPVAAALLPAARNEIFSAMRPAG